MDMECYEVEEGNDKTHFKFFSEGPNGRIMKIVNYYQLRGEPKPMFNLSFGDRYSQEAWIDDIIVSNNNDRDKVLATVISTIIKFSVKYPAAAILITGSTDSRTRLYQMIISKFYYQITNLFSVEGYLDTGWESFKKGTRYEAFQLKPIS